MDLGCRADRRARRARGRLLFDRDRREDVGDLVDVRPFEAFEVLARVRGHGLDETALPLRVERVERERRLARARGSRDDRERAHRKRARDPPRLCVRAFTTVIASAPRFTTRRGAFTARRPRAGSCRGGTAGRGRGRGPPRGQRPRARPGREASRARRARETKGGRGTLPPRAASGRTGGASWRRAGPRGKRSGARRASTPEGSRTCSSTARRRIPSNGPSPTSPGGAPPRAMSHS